MGDLYPGMYCFPRAAITNYHNPGWLKTTEMYSLTVLEARSLKFRCQKAVLSLEALGENPPLSLPVSGGCDIPCGCITPIPASVNPCLGGLLFFSLCFPLLSLDLRPMWIIQDDPISRFLI